MSWWVSLENSWVDGQQNAGRSRHEFDEMLMGLQVVRAASRIGTLVVSFRLLSWKLRSLNFKTPLAVQAETRKKAQPLLQIAALR